ncbi:GNAT family N-acetyltransferase [Halovulum sp. GXIMD14793]
MTIAVRDLTGDALATMLEDVARLRIEVFRAFPYLYDGDMDYERDYLRAYLDSPQALVVGAFDGDVLIGAATGTPLADHADDFAKPFLERDYSLDQVFYCAESVLKPAYRGQGLGHAFFDHREAHARKLGFRYSTFCAVDRAGHPAKPAEYQPLDGFWTKRGYAKLPGVTAQFSWRDVGDSAETTKNLQFWIRELT